MTVLTGVKSNDELYRVRNRHSYSVTRRSKKHKLSKLYGSLLMECLKEFRAELKCDFVTRNTSRDLFEQIRR